MTAAVRLVGITPGDIPARMPDPFAALSVGSLSLVCRQVEDVEALSDRDAAISMLSEDLSALVETDHRANFIMFRLDTFAPDRSAARELGEALANSHADMIERMARYEERRLTLSLTAEPDEAPDPTNFLQATRRSAAKKANTRSQLDALETALTDLVERLDGQIDYLTTYKSGARTYAILIPSPAAGPLETKLGKLLEPDDINATLSVRQPILHFAPAELSVEAADD